MNSNKITSLGLISIILTLLFTTTHALTVIPTTITPETMETLLGIVDHYFFNSHPLYHIQLRKFYRAVFHDCMGGCDARLDLKRVANRGLQNYVDDMNRAYKADSYNSTILRKYLSRADFWVLASLRALGWGLDRGAQNSSLLPFATVVGPPFSYGRNRNDFDPCFDNVEGFFPDGHANWTEPPSAHSLASVLQSFKVDFKSCTTEKDIIVLTGLHGTGAALKNNSGFSGPWGDPQDLNVINNHFFQLLVGQSDDPDYTLVQQKAHQQNDLTPAQNYYRSKKPRPNKLQWMRKGNNGKSKIMLNSDVGMYHKFSAKPDGSVTGHFCPQLSNKTLYDCHKTDNRYLPLSHNAQLVFNYANNASLFYKDLITAYIKISSVPCELDRPNLYKTFLPGFKCVQGRAKCIGDVLLMNCTGLPVPKC